MSAAVNPSANLSTNALLKLEQNTQRFFRTALEAARDAAWQEVGRLGLERIMCENLVAMEQRALRKEATRLGLL